ncbi:sensor histidine kinase [Cellulosimicrobium marinum]|uniref:sensor histidine kinase n=1 Tax=Cellulosimicrobium marinum TaxID=1638992 RepID=UPI001E5E4396|nr:HAMP domain-containing sensor histidine kinase [Cellulosimicrobium marinum]MCB7137329.1 HAMP domain-containing protein [Cellulosimicrobium marinum]
MTRRRRTWSLRARLTALASLVLATALVVGALVLSSVVSSGRVAALDEITRERALQVARLAASGQVPDVLPVSEPGEVVQLLGPAGEVLASSATASRTLPVLPADELATLRAEADAHPDGTGDVRVVGTDRSAYDAAARVAVVPVAGDGGATAVASMPLQEVEGVVRALRVALAVVVPLLTLVAAAVIWAVLGRALSPVEELRRGAAAIARSGGPGTLPVPRADDELGALARTLNAMLDSLRAAEARQRSFVADAAHELRSPVAALRASVEVARLHPASFPADELAAELEDEVLRLQALVDDLLVLARLGARAPHDEDVDLGAVAHEVAATTAERRPGERARPRVEIRVVVDGRATARGDRAAVARILRNLVDNAVRHAASRVRVTAGPGLLVVDDDGPGIDVADRERVFERFTRLDEARERDAGGTGLGLAIARETAREHGDDVVLGESPLGGLRAEVRLSA